MLLRLTSFLLLSIASLPVLAQGQAVQLRDYDCNCTLEEDGLQGPVQSVTERYTRKSPERTVSDRTTSTTYSLEGLRLERVYSRDGEVRSRIIYAHESDPRRIVIESTGRPGSADDYRETHRFNAAGQVLVVDHRQPDGSYSRSEWSWTEDGLLETYIEEHRTRTSLGTSEGYRRTEYSYDDSGRLNSKTESCDSSDCALEVQRFEYPASNALRTLEFSDCRLEDAEPHLPSIITEQIFDAADRVVRETVSMTAAFDGSSRYCGSKRAEVTVIEYRSDGQVAARRQYEPDGRLFLERVYEYDAAGRQTTMINSSYREGEVEPSVSISNHQHEAELDRYGNAVSESEVSINSDGEETLRDTFTREIVYY